MHRVYVNKIADDPFTRVREALEFIGWKDRVEKDARVFIKPNLTYPEWKPGITTSLEHLESIVKVLVERTRNITIGESDGGYHSFTADQAIQAHGIPALCDQYGIGWTNLCREKIITWETELLGRKIRIPYTHRLLYETDVFITCPVPKVHFVVGVTASMKNQWGTVPDTMRLLYHYQFSHAINKINLTLKPITIVDGRYFLDRNGPVYGDPIPMDLIVAAPNPGVADLVLCRIMNVDAQQAPYLRIARRAGLMPESLDEIEFNQEIGPFCDRQFELRRNFLDWLDLIEFYSKTLTWLVYASPLAEPVHKMTRLIRRIQRRKFGVEEKVVPEREAEQVKPWGTHSSADHRSFRDGRFSAPGYFSDQPEEGPFAVRR